MMLLKHTNVNKFQRIRAITCYLTFKMSFEGHETAFIGMGMFPTVRLAVYFFKIVPDVYEKCEY